MGHTRPVQLLWVAGAAVFFIVLLQVMSGDGILPNINLPKSFGERVNSKPRYIFVDLGANSADTLDVFLQRPNSKFEFDFPHPDWATHEQAEIFLFEANPTFNTVLVQAKERNEKLGIKVNIFPSTVVDVRDGTRTFFLDTVNNANDFFGSSIYAAHPDVVRSKTNGTELTSINISRWLLQNTLPQDFVVVKMDIEGSEYEVVPHMAEMSVWTVVDYLMVEWHNIHFLGGTEEDIAFRQGLAEAARDKLKAEGVLMPTYDSPS